MPQLAQSRGSRGSLCIRTNTQVEADSIFVIILLFIQAISYCFLKICCVQNWLLIVRRVNYQVSDTVRVVLCHREMHFTHSQSSAQPSKAPFTVAQAGCCFICKIRVNQRMDLLVVINESRHFHTPQQVLAISGHSTSALLVVTTAMPCFVSLCHLWVLEGDERERRDGSNTVTRD